MELELINQHLHEQHLECQLRSSLTHTVSLTLASNSLHQIHRIPDYINPDYAMSKSNRGDSSYQKRVRHKPEEINRVYICNWLGCDKAYGCLSHLNYHVKTAGHGPIRQGKEFQQISCVQPFTPAGELAKENAEHSVPSGNTIKYSSPTVAETGRRRVRPLNAFMIYRKDKRKEIQSSHQRTVSRIVGMMWKHESPDIKTKYHALAEMERENNPLNYSRYKPKTKKAIHKNSNVQQTAGHPGCQIEETPDDKPPKSEDALSSSPSERLPFSKTVSTEAKIFEKPESKLADSAISCSHNPSDSFVSTTEVHSEFTFQTLKHGYPPTPIPNTSFPDVSQFVNHDGGWGHRPLSFHESHFHAPGKEFEFLANQNLSCPSVLYNSFDESQLSEFLMQQNDVDTFHMFSSLGPQQISELEPQLQHPRIQPLFGEEWNWIPF